MAYPYRDKLNQSWQAIVFNNKYKYYNFTNYWSYEIGLNNDSWNKIEMISVNKNDEILGFLSASCDRSANKISNVGAINFKDVNLTFSKDFHKFLNELFTLHNFNKIEWDVLIGNPAEKMYDKIIKKYGGSIVGVQHESAVLMDGTFCDVKEYELFKRDYLKHIKC